MKKILPALALILLFSSAAQAQVFKGSGSAVIIDGAEAKAKELAEKSAVRKAVSEAMLSFIPEGSADRRKFNANKGKLLKEGLPFIKSSNVTSEKTEGNMMTVDVMVAVDSVKMKAYLSENGIFAEQNKDRKMKEFPSVTVLIAEEISGGVNTSPYSANVIRQALIDEGFDVVDEKVVQKSIKHDQAVQALLNNDLKDAQAVTLQYGAGLLISGKAVVQKSAVQSGGMQVQGANVTLQAIKADSGKVLTTSSAESHYPHINALTGSRMALEEAAAKASERLIKNLSETLEVSSDTVLVSISGINYKQLAIIKKMFQRDFKEISNIKQNSFNGSVAKLDITLQASVTEFMDSIALHDFGTFNLNILNYSPGKVDMSLKLKALPSE